MTIERILAPTDFSDASSHAADVAWGLARQQDAQLLLFHVDELPQFAVLASEPVYVPPQAWDALSESYALETGRRLNELKEHLSLTGAADRIQTAHTRGDAVDRIVARATEAEVDLIVLGSHGHSGSLRYLFGGVAAKVSRLAPCPVLITRPESGTSGAEGFSRALVAVDFSALSAEVAQVASKLVAPTGHLSLVHVWQEPAHFAVETAIAGVRQQIMAGLEQARGSRVGELHALANSNLIRQTDVSTHLELGTPAHSILEFADKHQPDVIVIGTHSREGVSEHVLGTVADRVLRHAKVPVLLVPFSDSPAEPS